MTDSESKLRQRTDGHLDRSRDAAILNAAVAVLAEYGYDAANMTGIATGRVGKAALGTAQLGEAGKRCVAIVVPASADRRRGVAGRCC